MLSSSLSISLCTCAASSASASASALAPAFPSSPGMYSMSCHCSAPCGGQKEPSQPADPSSETSASSSSSSYSSPSGSSPCPSSARLAASIDPRPHFWQLSPPPALSRHFCHFCHFFHFFHFFRFSPPLIFVLLQIGNPGLWASGSKAGEGGRRQDHDEHKKTATVSERHRSTHTLVDRNTASSQDSTTQWVAADEPHSPDPWQVPLPACPCIPGVPFFIFLGLPRVVLLGLSLWRVLAVRSFHCTAQGVPSFFCWLLLFCALLLCFLSVCHLSARIVCVLHNTHIHTHSRNHARVPATRQSRGNCPRQNLAKHVCSARRRHHEAFRQKGLFRQLPAGNSVSVGNLARRAGVATSQVLLPHVWVCVCYNCSLQLRAAAPVHVDSPLLCVFLFFRNVHLQDCGITAATAAAAAASINPDAVGLQTVLRPPLLLSNCSQLPPELLQLSRPRRAEAETTPPQAHVDPQVGPHPGIIRCTGRR